MHPTAAAATADMRYVNARLERLPYCSWHTTMGAIAGAAWFFDAFDALTIAFVLPVLIGLWKLTPGQIGVLIAIGYGGQLLASITAGWAAERWGRIPTMIVTLLIFTVMAFACALAPNYQALLWFRFIQGLGLGGETPVMHAYVNEFANARWRGRFAVGINLIFVLGLAACSLTGVWVVPHLGWQWMFIIGAVPALLVIPLRLLLPESPRWLASKGRFEEADRSLKRIEGIAVKQGKVLPPVPRDLPPVQEAKIRLGDLFKGIYLKRTITLWVLWFSTFTITYGVVVWAPSLFRTVFKLPVEQSLLYGFVLTLSSLTACIINVIVIDYVRRKLLLAAALFVGSLPLLWFLVPGDRSAIAVLWVACISYFCVSFPSLTLGMYTAECYPNHMRALGAGIAIAWLRLAAIVAPLFVGFILPIWGLNAVFVSWGVVALIGAIVCVTLGTETRGKVLEVISPPL